MSGKFDGFLLCSDFDGTLTSDGKTVSRENLEAIEQFEAEGGLFTMASGRFPTHFDGVEGLKLNTYSIALNGNVIYDRQNERVVWSCHLEAERVKDIIHFTETEFPDCRGLTVNSLTDTIMFSPSKGEKSDDFIARMNQNSALFPAIKIIIMQVPAITGELRRALETNFPDLAHNQSWPQGIEIYNKSGGKGNAVNKLREILGGREKIHTVVCVGDYENDISMLECADIGYAVSNSLDSVKAAADRITVSNKEHAISAIIRELA